MRFIPPMLCTTLGDPRRLGDPRYVAEPKFDGQRAQIHAFDVLQVDGQDVMAEPWCDRRKRLEDIGSELTVPNATIVPVTDDAAQLWATWVGWGGEGIVLKDRRSPYRPGVRWPDWLKVKASPDADRPRRSRRPRAGAVG